MVRARGRWSERPSPRQIEQQAVQLLAEFRQKLEEAGLNVPSIPPVPVEYLALTVTDLTVRGVEGLKVDGKKLAGLLDPEQAEICYEEFDPIGRRNFSIAHELGHYYLHYLLPRQQANQPSLFQIQTEAPENEYPGFFREGEQKPTRFYRCSESEIGPSEEVQPGKITREHLSDPATQAKIVQITKQKEWASRLEWEANVFADALLMPAEWVRALHEKHGDDIKAIAAELDVTPSAIRYRLNMLKLRQDEDGGVSSKGRSKSKKDSHTQGTFL